jgi:NO-binding membrane sensor protein with MHYT domain
MFGSRVQIFAILATAGLFLAVFELVRRRRLMERYALLWLVSAAVLLGLSVWRNALESFSTAIGIYYAPSAFFVAALAAILAMLLHFSLVISRLADQTKVLAQRLAAQQARIDQLEAEARSGEPVELEAPLD